MDATLKFAQDVIFLALTIWREARSEPFHGKVAVGYTVMNRVIRPKWWGRNVLDVVTKKWQYSSMTDPKDRQLTVWPTEGDSGWVECLNVARGVYDGTLVNPVPGADSYFADYITPPKWADAKKFVAKIGRHSFYDLDADYERQTS